MKAPELLPYLNDAAELAEHETARLAAVVGGGECGTAPSLLVASAALKTAGSRYAFAQGNLITGSRLADAARADLLAAHELAAREAKARPRDPATAAPWLFAGPGEASPAGADDGLRQEPAAADDASPDPEESPP